MRKEKKKEELFTKKKLVTTAFAMTLLLTGCGSSDDNKNVSKNTGKETFTIDMECSYVLLNWQAKEQARTNVPIGGTSSRDSYDIRVACQIARNPDREIVIKKVSWDGLQSTLGSGEIDAIIVGVTKSEARENGTGSTSPYYESEMVMIVRKGDEAAKLNDIQQSKGKTVIRQKSTNYDTIIDQIKGVEHVTSKAVYSEMTLSLQNKKMDGITIGLPIAEGAVETGKDLTTVRFAKDKGLDIDTSMSVGLKGRSRDSELFNTVQRSLDGIPKKTRDQWVREARESQPKTE